MGLLKQKELDYYIGRKEFTGDGSTTVFTLTEFQGAIHPTLAFAPGDSNEKVKLFLDETIYPQVYVDPAGVVITNYSFEYDAINGWAITFVTAPSDGAKISLDIKVDLKVFPATSGPLMNTAEVVNNYNVTSLENIINNFMVAYTGEDKVISKVSRTDVQFHAMRTLQELSFDTFKSNKAQEIEVPPSLLMQLPQDYVNYVKLTYKDARGIEHVLYPELRSSNPEAIKQRTNGEYDFDINDDGVEDSSALIHPQYSDTWTSYKGGNNTFNKDDLYDFEDDTYWPYLGSRYGIEPGRAQINGSFYIDEEKGLIHFSSSLSGSTITLRYISDSLGTDSEMVVHKFAEEAMYKSLMYAILSTRANVQEYVVQRYKRERFAAVRKAKLRLSNIKIEELTQILRGKSKWIKH